MAIIDPYGAYDLMRDPEWIGAHKYAQRVNLYEGESGEIAGVRFVQTSRAKVFKGAGKNGADVYSTLILADDAYGITEITGGGLEHIVKQLVSAGTMDGRFSRIASRKFWWWRPGSLCARA